LSGESSNGGWQDIPIRVTVVGKVKELMPNRTTAVVEVSGAQFVATFDPSAMGPPVVGSQVLIDEEYASIVGPAPLPSGNGRP